MMHMKLKLLFHPLWYAKEDNKANSKKVRLLIKTILEKVWSRF